MKYLKNYNINYLYNLFTNTNIVKNVIKEYKVTKEEVKTIIIKMMVLGYKINTNNLNIYNSNDGLLASYTRIEDIKEQLNYYKNNNIDIIEELANNVANNISRYKRGYKIY